MGGEWRSCTIGGLCDAGVAELQTGPFGSQLHAYDYVKDGVPIVPTAAISNRRIDHSLLPMIPVKKAEELARHRLRPGDILFARRGVQATGHVGFVREAEAGFLCGTGAIRLRINPDGSDVSREFLSHVLANPASVEWFKFHAIGATMPNLNEGIIRSFPLQIPPLPEQRAIAHILGTLDDKIELNGWMNETLEAMARALFKSWFVDFDPVRAKAEDRDPGLPEHLADLFPDRFVDSELGEIPEGWEVRSIEDLLTLSREGVNPSDSPDEVFDHYSIPAYDESCTPKAESGVAIKSNKHLVLSDSVLLSKLNPRIPRVWLPTTRATDRAVCSTEFLVVRPKPRCTRDFLYCLFTSNAFMSEFATLVTGTSGSHQRVRPQAFLNLSVIVPPPRVVERFTSMVSGILSRVAESREESRTLATLRDTLLPRLMSGELRVKNPERFAARECS